MQTIFPRIISSGWESFSRRRSQITAKFFCLFSHFNENYNRVPLSEKIVR